MDALRALDRFEIAGPADLGLFQFLLAPGAPGVAARFTQATLGPLLARDHDTGSSLLATIETYLDCGRQHAATAARLHVHPNTLYQRLARVDGLIGTGWRDPGRGLDLHLALRLLRLLAPVPS